MKKELDELMLEDVTGGTVIISKDAMKVGFSTTKEMYDLKNCSYRQARDLRDDELEKNLGLNNAEFDKHMKELYQQNGWI